MKYFLIIAMALGFSSPVMADESCVPTVTATVNGLVCDFCARALEKVFSKREEVAGIAVDLDIGKVDIQLKDGKTLDDATINGLISDAGYSITEIKRGGC